MSRRNDPSHDRISPCAYATAFALSAFLILFGFFASACPKGSTGPWKMDQKALTAKAQTIYVIQILARIQARGMAAYRAQVLQTLKGKRVEQLSFDLNLPSPKFNKDTYAFALNAACEPVGNLLTGERYIFYPGDLRNLKAIIPVKDLNDPIVDQIENLANPQPEASKAESPKNGSK